MTAMTPNETSKSWRQPARLAPVQLYLCDHHTDSTAFVGARIAGFQIEVAHVEPHAAIDPHHLTPLAAAVVEVAQDDPRSIARFQALASASETPLIAAAFNPPLALVRTLVRAGAHDVVPLPLDLKDLEASLAPIRDRLQAGQTSVGAATGKLVSIVKSAGGAGATSLLGQMAIESARKGIGGKEVCLIDLDVQFGDAAFQLGLQPNLSLADLLDAGSRLDGEMLRTTAATHSSGLKVIAAPPTMMPLEALSSDQVLEIVEQATREFGLVYVDLPANWTNWSLSLLARSDIVLLVTEISVTGLNRARRQIELIQTQDLGDLEFRVVANRFEKGVLKQIRPADIRQALGRDVAFTIANDPQVMSTAIDRGVPIDEIKRRSAIGKDIAALTIGVAKAVGLER
ncbi:MAG: pilus assembly protein CpaE [Sphingomicrobium sp.]